MDEKYLFNPGDLIRILIDDVEFDLNGDRYPTEPGIVINCRYDRNTYNCKLYDVLIGEKMFIVVESDLIACKENNERTDCF